MPPVVRVRRAIAVPLPSAGAPAPGCRVRLSPFDTYWASLPPVCRVFLFQPAPSSSPPVPFSDVVRSLRSSLAAVLPAFHPFAGELTYSPESHAVHVACGEDAHVAFVEAETELELASLLEEGAAHDDLDVLQQLVPDIRREELPAPVMAAQVTEFVGRGGGIAVGVAFHHTVADGRGMFRFLEMWAAAAVAGAGADDGRVAEEPAPPLHDRNLVRFDGDEELSRVFLRQLTPDLPRIAPKQDPTPVRPLSRRTFTFSASALRSLKQRLAATGPGTAPSTFAALAAHAWVSLARASGFTDGAPVFAGFLADCRALMSPPVPDTYAGNCVAPCVVALSGAELTGPDGHLQASLTIRKAIAEVKLDPLADRSRWVTKFVEIPAGRAVALSGSPWFPAYAMDFGFGRPARVDKTTLNYDGDMAIIAGKEAGWVQVSVAIAAHKMPAFREMFAVRG